MHNHHIAKARKRKTVSKAAIALCRQQARKFAHCGTAFSENLPIGALLRIAGQSALGLRFVLCNKARALGDEVAQKLRQAVEDSTGTDVRMTDNQTSDVTRRGLLGVFRGDCGDCGPDPPMLSDF
jgi:hypothetical protein